MRSGTSVIVEAAAGGRALLLTADSLARQRATPADLMLVKVREHPSPALLESVVARLGARAVEAGDRPGAALNEAARSGHGRYLAVVPSGFALRPCFLDHCAGALDSDDRVSAIAPSVRLHTPDGVGSALWIPGGVDVATALADPRSVPPVFVVRQSVWESMGGYDEALEGLVDYEFWLRLVLTGHRVMRTDEPLVTREAGTRATAQTGYLTHFKAVLTAHREAIAERMHEVLLAAELRFGRSRDVHRDLLARRDADLEELDRLRAGAAHHRAYLEHHGRISVDWGDLRRVDPISRDWGYDRGEPVDRRYIQEFLSRHSSDIHGSVLEIQEDDFARAFGGPRVTEHGVLDIDAANPRATILADLRCAPQVPSERFDCVILTQTLHVIDDMPAALRECYRILKPGGVLLATMPAASRVCLEYGEEGDLWRMTPAGARALVHSAFGPSQTSCDVFGNVLTNTAFLQGLAAVEIADEEFDACDPYFPALTGLRARKASLPEPATSRGVVLLYHRVDDAGDLHDLSVPRALFESHLAYLRESCSLMTLDDLLRTPPESLPGRAVAITFDDGYLDCVTVAAPLLRRHDAPATFFLTSRWLDEPGEYWWDALERILVRGAALPPALSLDLAGSPRRFATVTADDRIEAHWSLHDAMVHAPLEERDRILDLLRAWSGAAPGSGRIRPMLAEEVRELAGMPGVTIGSHTVNHLALPDQPPEVRQREIAECRNALARLTGMPIDLFAYPYGAVDRESASLVRQSSRWGLSCDNRILAHSFDAARVPRLDVKRWEVPALAETVEGLFRRTPRPSRQVFTRLP